MKKPLLSICLIFTLFAMTHSFSQEMTMFLGVTGYQYYVDDHPLITAEVHSLLYDTPEAFNYWKKSRTYNTIAVGSNVVALGTTLAILVGKENKKAAGGLVAASVGSTIISVIFYLSANTQKKKAVLIYNKGLESKPLAYIKPLISEKGVGITLQF